MQLLEELLAALPDGKVLELCIGVNWTAVVVQVGDETRCGLASTLSGGHNHSAEPDVPQAGQLQTLPARELAHLARSENSLQAGIGLAALNALLPPHPDLWQDLNAEEVIATQGADKTVALIGSFPFVPRLRPRVGRLFVLDLQPKDDEFPAEAAPELLPQADIIAITSMTFVNHSLENLLNLCRPQATILLLGPTTPLSPLLFEHNIDLLSGAVVMDIDRVLTTIKQGANFRQVHRAGVRLVTMRRGQSSAR